MPFEQIPLNDGNKIPAIAFGTGTALFGNDATEYVARALDNGFSHVDTAQIYNNEESVGQAIKESGFKRSDLFITTKWGRGDVRDALDASLSKLGLKQVDLYLIHFPGLVENDIENGWKQLERIKDEGLAKSIGVSNFDVEQLQTLLKTAKIKPAVNQIRFHPYNYSEHKALLDYSAQHGIITEAYSSLTPITRTPGGPVDAPIASAAARLGATPAQVIFLWVRSKGAVIVTTTSNVKRLKEYQAVADLPPLTQDEIDAIDEAGAQGPSWKPSAHRKSVLALALVIIGFIWFRIV
ncbi:NADP-dependent oxidoreductase domain-containing protein [Mucidula mucida]|nr:NADP-dependent oxidoreductase domain-containing protein [Mucidula mucida]